METAALRRLIERVAPGSVLQCVNFGRTGQGCAWIEAQQLKAVCGKLRSLTEGGYEWLENLSIMHMDDTLVLSYFLRSRLHDETVILRTSVTPPAPDEKAQADSVAEFWPMAEPFEDEAAVLFGIRFVGWKSRRGIFAAGWSEGFPLRKNFQVSEDIVTPSAEVLE